MMSEQPKRKCWKNILSADERKTTIFGLSIGAVEKRFESRKMYSYEASS